MANYGYQHEQVEKHRSDQVAARIEQFEEHGWPIWIVRFLNSNPTVSLHEAIFAFEESDNELVLFHA